MDEQLTCSSCFYWWRHRRSDVGECLKTDGGSPVFEFKTREESVCCFYLGKGSR